LQYSQPVVT